MGVTRRKRRAGKSINGNIRDEIEKELNLVELGLVNKLSNCLPCFVDFFYLILEVREAPFICLSLHFFLVLLITVSDSG